MRRMVKNETLFSVTTAILFVIIFLTAGNVEIQAQTTGKTKKLFAEATGQFEKKNYDKAISICNKILKINPDLVGVEMLLANSYQKKEQTETELQHLFKAMKLNSHPYIKWRLAEAYLKLGNYSEALNYYNIYSNYKYISEKRRMELACKRASCIFNIMSLKKNVEDDIAVAEPGGLTETYWPESSPDGRKLVFVPEGSGNVKQTDTFIIDADTINGGLYEPFDDSLFIKGGDLEIPAHRKLVFFTGYNRPGGYGDGDIYFSRYKNGKWSDPVNAGYKINTRYLESQPFFTADNRYLYFTSNRPGGAGKKDIWRAELIDIPENGNPVWSTPVNISAINGEGNEISPFFYAAKNQLYFASNSYPGMGGYDVFVASVDNSGAVTGFENIGADINTDAEDIAAIITPISDTAFFSLGRIKNNTLEIFSYNFVRGLRTSPKYYMLVKVVNANTSKPVIAEVEVADNTFRPAKIDRKDVNEKGELLLPLLTNREYTLNIAEPGYMFYSKTVKFNKANSTSSPEELLVELIPIEVGSTVDLYNIYFETNSYAILPGSEAELKRVALFLGNNKKLKVEIQGHTDSSGSAENNMTLSNARAKSVVDYLVSKGIEPARLSYKGYGDTKPVADNSTPEGRKLNRRTTIKIIEK